MRSLHVLAAVAVALAPVPAGAEVPPDRARELFVQGVEAFGAEEYPAALEAFEASYEANPVNSVLYNIAMCQRALFRYADSIGSFERYLDRGGDRVSEERRAEVVELVAEMDARLGRLTIEVRPGSAEVLLDGEPVPPDHREALRLTPGSHAVAARAPGFEELTREVEIEAGRLTAIALGLVAVPLDDPPGDGGALVTGDAGPDGGDAGSIAIHRRWWFWVAVIGAAAVVGLGIGLGLGLSQQDGVGSGDWGVELP